MEIMLERNTYYSPLLERKAMLISILQFLKNLYSNEICIMLTL